jgi:capsid portal protein
MSLKSVVKAFIRKTTAQQDRRDQASLDAECWNWPLPFDTLVTLPGLSVWHARCIEVIATAAVGVGFSFEADSDEADRKAREAIETVAGPFGASDLFAFAAQCLRGCGNAYWEFTRSPDGAIAEWFPALPQTFWILKNGEGFKHRAEPTDPRIVRFRAFDSSVGEGNELVHLRTLNMVHRHYGIPPWMAAVAAMELDQKALQWNSAHFDNNAVPPWALSITGGEPDEKVEEKITEFLSDNFKGPENAGRLLYLAMNDPNVKVEWQRLADEAKDGSYHTLRMDNRDEIVAAHGVPPRILGIMASGALGGGGEVAGQIMIFDQVVLQPLREKIARAWNTGPGRTLGLPPLTFDKIDITTGKEDAEALATLAGAGIISPDEARGELGYGETDTSAAAANARVAASLDALERRLRF